MSLLLLFAFVLLLFVFVLLFPKGEMNPPILSLRLLSLSSLSKTSRARAKKERKKERKHSNFVRTTFSILLRKQKQLEKEVLTLVSYFQMFFELIKSRIINRT